MKEEGKKKEEKRFGGKDSGGGEIQKRTFHRRRVCRFCANRDIKIDYKDRLILTPFLTERGKIIPRRISGNCSAHQREMTLAIKRGRHIAVIAYSSAQN